MAAGAVTTTTAANYIPELWSLEVIDSYTNNCVFESLVDRSFQELARAGHGDTINVPQMDTSSDYWAMDNITQGDDITRWSQKTEGVTPIVVTTYKGLRLVFPSIVLVQSLPSLRTKYTEQLGVSMARTIDTAIASLVASIPSPNATGTLNVDLTDDNLLEGRRLLDVANAPTENRTLVVHPNQLMGLYKVEKYSNSLYRGTAGNLAGNKGRGYIGPLYDFDVYESTNVVANGSGHDNVYFQKRWVALVIQEGPVLEQWRNVTKACDEITIRAIYGVKEMRATSAVWMKGL